MKKSATPTVQASSLLHRMFGVGAGAGNSLPVRKLMVAVLLAAAATCLGVFAVAQTQAADGAMTGVTLTSGSPGTLTVSWNTPSPAPTDYRLRWAPVGSRPPLLEEHQRDRPGQRLPGRRRDLADPERAFGGNRVQGAGAGPLSQR